MPLLFWSLCRTCGSGELSSRSKCNSPLNGKPSSTRSEPLRRDDAYSNCGSISAAKMSVAAAATAVAARVSLFHQEPPHQLQQQQQHQLSAEAEIPMVPLEVLRHPRRRRSQWILWSSICWPALAMVHRFLFASPIWPTMARSHPSCRTRNEGGFFCDVMAFGAQEKS